MFDGPRRFPRFPPSPRSSGRPVSVGRLIASLPLRTKLLAAVLAMWSLLLGQTALVFRAELQSQEVARRVEQTHTVLRTASDAWRAILKMQADYRGFLLTGRDELLVSYAAARERFASNLTELERLTSDNPPQVERWRAIGQAAEAWQAEATEPAIAARRAIGPAVQPDGSIGGPRIEELGRLFDEAIGVERELLEQRGREQVAARSRVLVLLALSAAIAVGCSAAAGWFLMRDLGGGIEQLARAATRLARGDLGARVGLARSDEIGQAGAAFDRMAERLENTIGQLGALAEARAIHEAAAVNLADGLAIMDRQNRVIFWNPRMETLFDVPRVEAVGRPIQEVTAGFYARTADPAETMRRAEAARQAAATGKLATFEYRLDGEPARDLEVLVFPIMGPDGSQLGHGRLVRDVTQERENERLKDELVSVVSHELRTPLASLVGFAELLLLRDFPDAERREFLAIMLDEGRRLTALINDFLDLQRIRGGGRQIAPRPVDPRELVERAVAATGDDPGLPIVVDMPEQLPAVLADPDAIQQVLQNLISNSRKYSPRGGQIRIHAAAADDRVALSVSDQGLGIPPEALPRLFEKFYRIDNSDHRTIKGTGLGLAIVKEIVELHGGRVQAESPGPGQGSTFTFTLPVAVGAAALASREREAAVELAPEGYILAVEDDQAFGAWLRETLSGAGYSVRLVQSGEAALEAVRERRPAAMLLDLGWAGTLDRWDVLGALRGEAATADLPVVIVSAISEPDRARALGVADYLVKPVGAEQLLRSLRRLALADVGAALVAEDDPDFRRALVGLLAGAGLPALGVGTGEEALGLLRVDPTAYRVLLLDLGLPGMDGFGVLEAVRSEPATAALPVVVVTGRELSDAEKRRLTERAAEVLQKGGGASVPILQALARALGRELALTRATPKPRLQQP